MRDIALAICAGIVAAFLWTCFEFWLEQKYTPQKDAPEMAVQMVQTSTSSLSISRSIAIGDGALATNDHEMVITWDDGTESRWYLPTNKWIRGFK